MAETCPTCRQDGDCIRCLVQMHDAAVAELRRLHEDLRSIVRRNKSATRGRGAAVVVTMETLAKIAEQSVKQTAAYTQPPDGEYEKIQVDRFRKICKGGMRTVNDGHGHPMRDGREAPYIDVTALNYELTIPADATHIAWYNT